ncbi:hypothetical protein DIPPA_29279 [Diplonema papillatum]|nr:hypothetical protein DIPPA_29279 [Diplonema papillatum]
MLRRVARRRCATQSAAALPDVKLASWNTTADDVQRAADSTRQAAEQKLKQGEAASITCVGAKSVNAVLRGLAAAEQDLAGSTADSLWGGASKVVCKLQSTPGTYHTYTIHFSGDEHAFPAHARVVDVVDKFELQEDIFEWATTSPSGFHNDSAIDLPFDKNSPAWRKQWQLSGRELVNLLVQSPTGEALVRGMGPSLFNCVKVIDHAQKAVSGPVAFGLRKLDPDDAAVAAFKDGMKDYFERGLVSFRDTQRLPASRGDGVVMTPPQDYEDTDYFTIGFAVKMA